MNVAPIAFLLPALLLFGAGYALDQRLRRWPNIRWRRRFPLKLNGFGLASVILVVFLFYSIPPLRSGPIDVGDVRDWDGFRARLAQEAGDGRTPGAHIASRIDPAIWEEFQSADQLSPELKRSMARQLSQLLGKPDLYEPEAYAKVDLSPQLLDELERATAGNLDGSDLVQLQRVLLVRTYPEFVSPAIFQRLAVMMSLLLVTLLVLMKVALRQPLYQLGIHTAHAGTMAAYGAAQAFVWGPGALLLSLFVRSVVPQDRLHPAQEFLLSGGHWLDWLALGTTVVVLAPLLEELFFRATLQAWLCKFMSPWNAILLAGFLFGLAHGGSWPDPVPLTLLGVGFGVTYQRTRSLWAPVLCHATFNGVINGALILLGRLLEGG
ncbi:CAAX amino terminal protease self- immunity [Planctomycetes bacterium Pan216]|uniref:CAAX amino terminal protease self-immunity n=1 Tax=Kolteria novifilia TaxID=2527975 RepID=A0A518AXG6_9BACT|nr:CAAX amino terminal protease self- immunity [Planctomycetes bacterium Pan216]